MARVQKIHFVVMQNLDDGETIICLPKDLKKVRKLYFAKDSERDLGTYVTYNVYDDNVWLLTQHPSLESYYDERQE